MQKLNIKSKKKNELIEITSEIKKLVESKDVKDGLCVIFCPHTTAGITINEAFDPSVKTDIIYSMNRISPDYDEFRHAEGNSDAHIKSSLFGASLTLIINKGKLALGTWQGVYFTEFDGPRTREVWIKTIAG